MEATWRIGDDPNLTDPGLPTGARLRDCNVGGGRNAPGRRLLAWLVETLPGRVSHRGGRVLDPDDIEAGARFLAIKPASLRNELNELRKRETITLESLGDGQYRYVVTDAGETLYLERC